MIGIVIIVAYLLDDILTSPIFSKRFLFAYIPVIILFSVLSWSYAADYKDSAILRAVRLNLNNPAALGMRAEYYMGKKDTASALADINKAIELNPREFMLFFRRGTINQKCRIMKGRKDFTRH